MTKPMLLMMRDTPVMRINLEAGEYNVLNEVLIPYQIKGRLRFYEWNDCVDNRYNITQMSIAMQNCYGAIISFLSRRVLSLDRENSKKILNALRLEQTQDPIYRAKIALTCRAVSLQDNYWIKLEDDKVSWKDVNLRCNSLSNTVAQVALHGTSLTVQGKVTTPELTTHGAYAKCWKRLEGDLYLFKAGYRGSSESKIEVEVSDILDKCNVNHLRYISAKSEDLYCCKCKCMTTEDVSMLSGLDFAGYCSTQGLDYLQEAIKIDKDAMYKMFIIDYLISNPDRHGGNWGFFYNCNTMRIIRCHPLYDHNNAFDRTLMQDSEGGMSKFFEGKTRRQVALKAIDEVDFHFTESITRDDFIVESHYNSFKRKAKALGLQL